VFLTGKQEILYLQKRLKMHFKQNQGKRGAEPADPDDLIMDDEVAKENKASLPMEATILPLYS
jgi:HrpA-like RNA helicase